MDGRQKNTLDSERRERLVGCLDQMIESGRVTETEAGRLRTARGQDEFDSGVLEIRLRHARGSLDAAVREGKLTGEEADAFLVRLRNGEHPRELRAELRGLGQQPSSGAEVATGDQAKSSRRRDPA
jgi:hypothetical protein